MVTVPLEFLSALGIPMSAAVSALLVAASQGGGAAEEPLSPEEALQCLKDGNRRFVEGETTLDWSRAAFERGDLLAGQRPFATVLGCSDSRVPVEIVFDQGLGSLFVIRVAGNVAQPAVIASATFAIAQLHTPLVVVLGHTCCGAVTAAGTDFHREPEELVGLLGAIRPVFDGLDQGLQGRERIAAAVEANVRRSMGRLASGERIAQALASGSTRLVGAVYALESGGVRFLDE